MIGAQVSSRWKNCLALVFALALLLIYLPLAVMIVYSFNSARFPSFPFQAFSTRWYERLFANTDWWDAFVNSVTVAAGASLTATAIAFLCAYSLVNARFKGKNAFTLFVLAPLAVPLILLGLSLRVYMFHLGLRPSLVFVFLGHVVFVLPLAILNLRNRIARIPSSLEQAAWDLGASRLTSLRLIILPQCRLALIATVLLTFTFAFDEFIVAYFLTSFEQTLPIKIWISLLTGFDPTVNAVGTLVLLFSLTLGVAAQTAMMRAEGRRTA